MDTLIEQKQFNGGKMQIKNKQEEKQRTNNQQLNCDLICDSESEQHFYAKSEKDKRSNRNQLPSEFLYQQESPKKKIQTDKQTTFDSIGVGFQLLSLSVNPIELKSETYIQSNDQYDSEICILVQEGKEKYQ